MVSKYLQGEPTYNGIFPVNIFRRLCRPTKAHTVTRSFRTSNGMKLFITARKRSLGRGNIFRSVCQEFCPQGGIPGQVHPRDPVRLQDEVHPLGPGTTPSDQVHTLGTRYTSGDQLHPLGPGTPPWDQVHPHGTRYTPQN